MVEGYGVEGHAPAVDIRRLLAERPAVKGLTVLGMPMGSPGMEGPLKDPYKDLTEFRIGYVRTFVCNSDIELLHAVADVDVGTFAVIAHVLNQIGDVAIHLAIRIELSEPRPIKNLIECSAELVRTVLAGVW